MPRDPYPFAALRVDIAQDLEAYLRFASEYREGRASWRRRLGSLLMPSMLACLLYRLSHWTHRRGHHHIAGIVAAANYALTRVSIDPGSRIGGGLYIPHPGTGIVFQGRAGRQLRLFAGSAVSARHFSPPCCGNLGDAPCIGDDVALGSRAFVVGPVTIGSRVRVGFNAYVDRDLPDDVYVVAGTRTRLKRRSSAP